ncbi:hypothetical protein [Falsiphaeobacter marinintestinus]|uniref:hypothetical protein n=1 Tax=Falsiphaeobacter marinintestinus TaxID=1492905 RepID=UPI001FE8BB0E|nr:hypothetical protein [Phaeobacter marinintestinus]
MSEHDQIPDQIETTRALMRQKLGGGGATLKDALRKRGSRLPRRVRSQINELAEAETFATHPRLRFTLDATALTKAATGAQDHLNAIDLSDRRKGWWLGMLGGLAFNFLLATTLLIIVLIWRGYV